MLDAHRPSANSASLDLPDGRFHVCASGKPIFADDGSFVGYRGTVSDETELIERASARRAPMRCCTTPSTASPKASSSTTPKTAS